MAAKRPHSDGTSSVPFKILKSEASSSQQELPVVTSTPVSSSVVTPTAFIALPTILSSSSALPSSRILAQTSPSLNVPSGIIPLGGHHVAPNSQAYSVAHLAALANLSATFSQSGDSLTTPTTTAVIPPPLVASVAPDTPPPPYSTGDVSEEFSCSSPSQFLHSPKTIQSTSPTYEKKASSLEKQKANDNVKNLRSRILSLKKSRVIEMKLNYEKMLQEKFFLEGGGNMMDYQVWKKKPNILKDQYLKQHDLDSDVAVFEELLSPRDPTQVREKMDTDALLEQDTSLDIDPFSRQQASSDTCALTVPTVVTSTNTSFCQPATPASSVSSPSHSLSLSSPRPPLRVHSTLSSVPDVSHEDIVMRARHEAEVMKAISELRREGVWSSSRLPKVQEPPRFKTHWDYLLEEMHWLATDFANERRWKVNASKKLCRTVARHHQEHEQQTQRAMKEEHLRLRKIASTLAKEVRHFWDSIQKIVEHKQQAILEEKRRQAMDMHLNFIVDQTQKYSSWLMKGLNTGTSSSGTQSDPSLTSSALPDSDDIFMPVAEEGTDDEETIDDEEITAQKEGEVDYESEIHQLRMEGEMPLQDLIASLPDGLLDHQSSLTVAEDDQSRHVARKHNSDSSNSDPESTKHVEDDDYVTSNDSDEDETTIAEQEAFEKNTDYFEEINMLQEEGELPMEELLKLYLPEYDSKPEVSGDSSITDHDTDEFVEEDEFGLETLVSDEKAYHTEQGLNDVAAAAQELQPKGTTLSTTEVKTKIPFLLKHQLREYQHIGLDWLVTMHDKRLNGILADEMGLGKTIQTIALLAHLACEKANWGPHLIIVPTSVVLNWEFEFKKWCPGFKILTYLGSFKERKQKRVGWSKHNAFHVCITSYNIAVQDHRVFKQKKWKYLVLDEAQNIKNFRSQRWQTLLTFNSQHRLLLTGTPLQNNLMELWSLMHFLMPTVFTSHTDFKEWFSNPLAGMVEGSHEYNESIIERLHQVLRPFILRRLKIEVEKQLPSKYEHVVLCKLSKRQRFLYEDYMSRANTKETLSAGNYLSVINVLMQLRKVCNHPDLFELRPVASPFCMAGLVYNTASLVLSALSYDPFKCISLEYFNLHLASYELTMDAFVAYRSRQLQAPRSCLSCVEFDDSVAISLDEQSNSAWMDLDELHVPQHETTKGQRETLHRVNTSHCRRQPVYGQDMIISVSTLQVPRNVHVQSCWSPWLWTGYLSCHLQQTVPTKDLVLFGTLVLRDLLMSYEKQAENLDDILKRFVLTVLPVTVPSVSLHTSHPNPSDLHCTRQRNNFVHSTLSPLMTFLHPITTSFNLQFPETRLIQYDCGKLQTLDLLMRRLRTEGHRVLVFTQMTRMLDILEIFLTFHGYTYLRLDGATPVQKRQSLMEHFNKDPRVFCFILSTRSGGLGVNLTGADTVIFYDSDWNPTMDAQAQDRCHRIGQTRDVHIYRLICQMTIEENILKKAGQKRLLGDLAIESGGFTTDFFKKSNLNELFYSDFSGASTSTERMDEDITSEELEKLLLQAEEDRDVQAAEMARAEQVAEKAEFDEQYLSQAVNLQVKEADFGRSKVEQEFAVLEGQLSGIEHYVMRFIEMESVEKIERQLRQTEENIELAKKEWELGHLQQLREEEEKLAEEELNEEEVMNLTYDRPELVNKILRDEETGDEMLLWLPPTPPNDDSDSYYVDSTMEMSYNTSTVLAPDALAGSVVYSDDDYDVFGLHKALSDPKPIRKSQKSVTKSKKENMSYPQSLFWRRYTPDILTTRIRKLSPQTKKVKSKAEQFTPLLEAQDGPEWLSVEDWVLIKGLTTALELPLFLNATVPAQMPNWTILADLVTSLGKTKRSAVQCKDRIVGVIIPHEEQVFRSNPHALDDMDLKKQRSKEGLVKKHKSRRDHRSKNQVLQDKGRECTKLFDHCFHWIMKADWKSKQQSNLSSSDGSPRSSMHAELLHKDYDITYGIVHAPTLLAQQRAERIQSEIPRSSQMHQILSQGPVYNVQMARAANLVKPFSQTDSLKTYPSSVELNHTAVTATVSSRPAVLPSVAPLTPRIQTIVSSSSAQTLPVVCESVSQPGGQTSSTVTTPLPSFPVLGRTGQFPGSTLSTTTPVSLNVSNSTSVSTMSKSYSGVDISKGLFLGQRLTQQQLLLLRQTALQQQQLQQQQQQLQQQQQYQQKQQQSVLSPASQIQISPTTVSHVQLQRQVSGTQQQSSKVHTKVTTGGPAVQVPAKLQIPGIEQLRPAISLSSPRVPSTLVRAGLPARSMQTDEVLALLRQQQALRIAMQTQTAAKLSQQSSNSQSGLNEAIAAAAMVASIKPPTKSSLASSTVENVKMPADQVPSFKDQSQDKSDS